MSAPIRYGIVGTGMMGCEHILNIGAIDDAEVVAVTDPHPTSIEWALSCAGADHDVTVHADVDTLLDDDRLDAVVVATPNHTHIDVLESALATSLHVMVEKPLCTTVADCLRVRELADRRDGVTWVALEYRFMPTIATLMAELDTGVCGTVRMVSIREHRFPFLDKVGGWNRFTANTGGTLVEKCCHFFDLMHQIAGARPTRVFASGGQDVNHLDEDHDGRRPDILDNAFVIVEFDNGVRGALDLSMFAEGGRFEQELTVTGDAAKIEATVPGDVVWVGERHTPGQHEVSAAMSPEVAYEGFHHGSSFLEHLRFIEQIRSGGEALVTVDDGLWSVAMGVAAHRSIETGDAVSMDSLGLS